ncbi:acetyl-CoA carboxylase biotin carboxyl carrier protein subunit [Millionella massiliensis]|uniref:acetyl-CoA carboxylase biotin carboxyl carrier protein subunit n=1 Tax=Millionella massiliensis TaxID=1871023 RepID=UPI0023A893F7|nr:acetyl-CoA carboxylase biotin carboxyl carrier protein subunit [Millionella massiliensis]
MNKKQEAAPEWETLSTSHGTYKTTLSAKYKNRTPWHAKDPRQIYSFIPGTITTIDVKVGDTVKEGDVLLTFKAMKMHNTYRSPISGKVARIHVSVDEVVAKGVLLIEFE